MRTYWNLIQLSLLILSANTFAQEAVPKEPLVQLLFNRIDNVQHGAGSSNVEGIVQSPATVTDLGIDSVSGMLGDACFDNSAAQGMGDSDPSTGTGILFFGNTPEVDALPALTVTLWYHTDTGSSLNDGGGRLIENGRDWLLFSDDPNRLRLEINLEGESSGIGNFPEVAEWVFLGVTYDDATDTAVYFKGTQTSPVVTIVERDTYFESMPGRSNPLLIGNNEVLTRAFDGCIDNVRIWDVPLTRNQLESVRQADISGDGSVSSKVIAEFQDADDLPATALNSSHDSVLEAVRGEFSSVFDVDMYRISIPDPSQFSAVLTPKDDVFADTGHLFLFNQFGQLVGGAAPDANGEVNLTLTNQTLLPGIYFLAATPVGLVPSSQLGDQASIHSATGVVTFLFPASQAVTGWSLYSFDGTEFPYSVELNGCFNNTQDYPLPFTEFGVFDGLVAIGYQLEVGKVYDFSHTANLTDWSTVTFSPYQSETQLLFAQPDNGRFFFRIIERKN